MRSVRGRGRRGDFCVRCVYSVRSCRRRIDPPLPFVKSSAQPCRPDIPRRHRQPWISIRCRCRSAPPWPDPLPLPPWPWPWPPPATCHAHRAGRIAGKVSLRSLHSLRRSLRSLSTNTYRVVSVRRSLRSLLTNRREELRIELVDQAQSAYVLIHTYITPPPHPPIHLLGTIHT